MKTCAAAPCKSCPYRRDVPSGLWHKREYAKLPQYDGEIADQLINGGLGLFHCHRKPDLLCAGWLATHGTDNLAALRLHGHTVDPAVAGYKSPVPVFSSGKEAAEHGMREIKKPSARATRYINRLINQVAGRKTMDEKPKHGQAAKTHCPRGHAYEGDNLILLKEKKDGVPTGRVKRQCRQCKRDSHKSMRAAEKTNATAGGGAVAFGAAAK